MWLNSTWRATRACAIVGIAVLGVGCGGASASGGQGADAPQGTHARLPDLESSPFQNEAWKGSDGIAVPVLYYARENVRVSGACRNGGGVLACEALDFIRNGKPIEIARAALDGRTSAGTKVCMRMNQPLVTLHDPSGNEDSFCRFKDGSLVSTGALEQYAMRVVP